MEKQKRWYLPDKETFEASGPYSLEQLKKKLKNGEMKIDDFVWNDSLIEERWFRFFEFKEFQQYLNNYPKCQLPRKRSIGRSSQVTKINFNYRVKGEYGEENTYRRYPRAPICSKAIVHNQEVFKEARCIDISEKGIMLEVDDNNVFQEGGEVVVTVIQDDYLGTFSVESVVVKNFKHGDVDAHGIFFLRIPPQVRRKIAEYVIKKLNREETQSKIA